MAKQKSTDEIYQELMMQMGSTFDNPISGSSKRVDPGDEEEFLTSKEISEQKKEYEDRYGPLPTGPVEIEEEVHFKRYTQRREHKYTESEMTAIRESCRATIVHDYSEKDIYHMSDEERRRNDMLNELTDQLGKLKSIYRQIDQYVEAMRVVVKAWEILERNNFVHTRDEFYQMVADGSIVSPRIVMPKMKGINNYNMDMVIKYISNPELDPSDLVPVAAVNDEDRFYERYLRDFTDDPEYQEIFDGLYDGIHDKILEQYREDGKDVEDPEVLEEIEEKALEEADTATLNEMELRRMQRLLTPEEVQFIMDHPDPRPMKVKDISRKVIRGYDRFSPTTKKKKKKLSKKQRYHRETVHQILNKIQNSYGRSSGLSSTYMVTNGIFDTDKPEENPFDRIRYTGSWADDDALWLYDIAVREELLRQHIPGDAYLTYADKEFNQFFKVLEDNGINVMHIRQQMNHTDETMQAERKKHEEKEARKIEAAIIQRITKLNDDPKFKKTVAKAEEELNKHYEDY